MDMIYVLVIGMIVGMANVIPGVSGGTMAVVFNIYDRFVNAITLNVKKLIKNWKFIVPLFGGMALGILLFSKIIEKLYNTFPVQTDYFFTGLIIGSIPMLVRYMLGKNNKKLIEEGKMDPKADKPLTVKYGIFLFICFAAGLALILAFNYLNSKYGTSTDVKNFEMPALSIRLALKLFFAGILGAVAMVVPGISGSLLMLIVGVWPIVIGAIPCVLVPSTFVHAVLLLLPNGIGVIVGILLGAKAISILLKKVPGLTYAVIVGLIFGSAFTLFPGFSEIHSFGRGIGVFICLCAGIALAFFSSFVTEPKKDNQTTEKTKKEGEEN
jgi:putative membrane protein